MSTSDQLNSEPDGQVSSLSAVSPADYDGDHPVPDLQVSPGPGARHPRPPDLADCSLPPLL